jgi:hypothetical protein
MPEWATFFEVRDEAGFNARRAADCVAMNLWPSRGLVVHGVEVKVERRDWLRELKDPAKSATIQRFCDFWWLAVSDEKIVKRDEVPETWGLLVLRGKSLVAVKEAPKLKAVTLVRGFVAALLRNATSGLIAKASVDEIVKERIEQHDRLKTHHQSFEEEALGRVTKAFKGLQDRVKAFKEASGIDINERWDSGPLRDPTKLGQAVHALMNDPNHNWAHDLQRAREIIAQCAADLDAALAVVGDTVRAPTEDA